MKKNKCIALILVLICMFLLVSCDINNIPTGKLLSQHNSPNGKYCLNVYLCDGNATTDYSIRGELVGLNDNTVKNIYWSYHEYEATVEWISDTIVVINGVKLDVSKNETYDWRKGHVGHAGQGTVSGTQGDGSFEQDRGRFSVLTGDSSSEEHKGTVLS